MKKTVQNEPLTEGSLIPKIIKFAVPVMLTGILQLLFSSADNIVVGRYVGSDALAALGPTGPLVTLIVNVLLGLSTGAAVCTAQSVGAGNKEEIHQVVHTAILTGFIGGVIFGVAGFIISKPCLILMQTPENLLHGADIYMKIYFAGLPFSMLFNFGAGILRSVGDTKHPLYYLTTGGAVNVILNLIFVIVFNMGIPGVAIATVISQILSASLVFIHFVKSKEDYRIEPRKLKIWPKKLMRILKLGVPAGLQGTVFSFSNVIIQSSINSFGALAMAGNSAATNLEGFVYTCMNAFYHTSLTFVGQHVGAGKLKRMKKVLCLCLAFVTITGVILGTLMCFFGDNLLAIYSPDSPETVDFGMMRIKVICSIYFLCGILEVLLGSVQGMGASMSPMVVSLFGACVIRLAWIATVFRANRTLTTLYISYPVSWVITIFAMLGLFIIFSKKIRDKKSLDLSRIK